MLNIPSNSIIIADSTLHLPLYEKILEQKGNTLFIKVVSLSSFIMPYYTSRADNRLEILYQYKTKLENLSKENAFYSSRNDSEFLNACLEFLKYASTYGIDFNELPSNTQKEKDIKEILELIKDIPLKEKETQNILKHLKHQDFSNVYILNKEWNELEYLWIKTLIDCGAHTLTNETPVTKHYFSCANARTQAQLVAETIIENNMDANDVQVALSNESDKQVLCQMFDHYKIPYTLLKTNETTNIAQKFIVCLKWIQDKSLNHFMDLLVTLYQAQDVYKYYSIFPHAFSNDFSISNITYKENALIDEFTFNTYKELEATTKMWIQEHAHLFNWTISDMEIMIEEIKKNHETLSQADLAILSDILSLIIQAKPYIKNNKDLTILIDSINELKNSKKPDEYKGVLIGSRKDITALKDTVFLLSAHAKEFPNLSLKNGVFDESYIQNTPLPSLKSRIDFQTKQIFDTLDLPNNLYVIVPESTYQSKNLESSTQMNSYMNIPCQFKQVKELSIFKRPSFDLSLDTAHDLYLKNNKFTGSVSRLEAFARCPLQHFIRYGLYLKETKAFSDIRIRGTILHHILEVLSMKFQKDYANVTSDIIRQVIEEEFEFARRIFPEKSKWLDAQINELIEKTSLILEQLKNFEKNWHMNIQDQEYKFSFSYPWNDMTIELYGYIDRIDASNTSFCIFDYKSSDKDISLKEFESGLSLQLATYTIAYQNDSDRVPVGNFYIALKTAPINHSALSLNYRKKIPELKEIETDQLFDEFITSRKLKGWAYQDISLYCDDKKQFATKKETPSFEALKEEHDLILQDIIEELLSGNIMPDHDKSACDYCAYRPICRNGRNEVTKTSRIEKEDK